MIMRMVIAGCIVFLAGLMLAPFSSASEKDKAIAGSTVQKGIYHITPVFKALENVEWKDEDGTIHSLPGEKWSYDSTTGRLTVRSDSEIARYTVYGERRVPWAWLAQGTVVPDTVKMLLEDREGVRGKDFEVDEQRGLVRLLDADLCTDDLDYYLSWCVMPDPNKPNLCVSTAFGSHEDRERVKQFLSPEGEKKAARKTIKGVLRPTKKPLEYSVQMPLEAEGMKVGLMKQDYSGFVKWMKMDVDFRYRAGSRIVEFLAEPAFDPSKEMLVVEGYPAKPKKIYTFGEPLPIKSVSVYLNGRYLEEGVGFLVDYIDGRVAILDEGIAEKDAKYYLMAGSSCRGNCMPNFPKPEDDQLE